MSTQYLTYPAAEEYLGHAYGVPTLRKMVHEKRIPHVKMTASGGPGRVMFIASELDEWIQNHRVPARAAS